MPKKAKYLPAKERRRVTVETVVELAAEQNPNDITTSAIAKRMGLTQGALFRHFPNKAAILQAVMEWVAERLLARVDQAIKAAPSSLAALEAIFMINAEFVSDRPGVPRMLFGELQRAEDTGSKQMVRILIHLYGKRLRKLINDGKADGEINSNLDTEAASNLFIGSIQGLVMQSLLVGDVSIVKRDAPKIFKIYLNGITSQNIQ